MKTTTTTKLIILLVLFSAFSLQPPALAQGPAFNNQGRRNVGARHLVELTAGLPSAGRVPGTDELKLAIGLPLRNQVGLKALIQDLYNPASPRFRRYLAADEFADKFGPSAEDYQTVIQFARNNHLVVEKTYGNRVLLDVRGKVSDIERAFGVHLHKFHHPVEARDFYAPDAEPTVEANVPILAVKGLDNYELPHPLYKSRSLVNSPIMGGSGPAGLYAGNDFRKAYAPGVANDGSGQTVALFQMDGYSTNDINFYEAYCGLPQVTLTNVLLDGFNGIPVNTNYVVEVSLDIEMVISMATNLARVMVYEAPLSSSGGYDILNQMATDNQAKQISSSWVIERIVTTPLTEQIYEQFAAQGQSFFQASGDQDSFAPAIYQIDDDPYVTTVGGTTLTTGPGATYSSETVWQAGGGEGSGGGISSTFAIPTYQLGVNMTNNQGSTTMRNVPDVALLANQVYVRANTNNYSTMGTSCAAPLWAGFMALVNQQAAATGHPAAGFINPAVYALGQSANYANCFHDIVSGNNTNASNPTNFFAVAGYDLCTGWGTPAGTNLINALVSPAVPPQFIYVTNQGTIIITRYGGASGAVSIPATLGGLPVTSIGDFAFYEWANVTSVTIPNSVTNIGVGAFADCPNLTGVTVSNGFVLLKDYAFAGCSNLSSVCFTGNAPAQNATVFANDPNVTVCYLAGSSGWSSTFDGRPVVELLVTTLNDSGPGSLRQMVGLSPPGVPVPFATNLSGQTITLTSGQINVSQNLTLDASGLPGGIQLNGNQNSAILSVGGGVNVTLNALTFTNGYAPGGAGGAIANNGSLTLNRCTLVGNSAGWGGAIDNTYSCTLANCTLTGNYAAYYGGAIENYAGTLTLLQCTVCSNSTSGTAGGVNNDYYGWVSLSNSIVAWNGLDVWTIENSVTDVEGTNIVTYPLIAFSGGVVFGSGAALLTDPMLGSLAKNGGPTLTMLPQFGSPAIDAADPNSEDGLTTDQRGLARVVGPAPDIGAVEFQEAASLVTTTADSGQGSLRYASTYSPVGSTITFATNLSGQTITVSNGQIILYQNHTIDASGLPGGMQVNGNHSSRIFNVAGGATVALNDLVITNGYTTNANWGGAIFNSGTLFLNNCTLAGNSGDSTIAGGAIANQGPLTVNGCTFSGNSAGFSGAIDNRYTCTLQNSTFYGNVAFAGNGGAIDNAFSAILSVLQCTLSGNSATGAGGALDNYLSQMTIVNSIVAGNGEDIYNWSGINSMIFLSGGDIIPVLDNGGGIVIPGGTLITADPLLGPLANNGGPTLTMMPQAGSPAIDAGLTSAAAGLTYDQRGPGFPRVTGGVVDIGAVEVQISVANAPSLLTGVGRTNGIFGFGFTNVHGASFTVFASTNLALPLNAWSNLGSPVESPSGSGHYHFTDPQATNSTQRFYRVRSP
jgi:hypothetical protein